MARFFVALALMMSLLSMPVARADAPDPLKGLIRLQVIARSDSREDQMKKLMVRDRVRALAAEIVRGAKSTDEAFKKLRANRQALSAASCARVEIREVDCPLRVYGNLVVPAGRYRTVRVILGGGAGRNWWCVLYPDLCGVDPLEADALKGDAPVTFYSEIMQWAQAMRGNEP
jgi:stage II sporulation protein R